MNRMNGILIISILLNFLLIILGIWSIQKLGGWRFALNRLNGSGMSAQKIHRVSQMEALSKSTGGIVMLGDSHTEYGEWHELLPEFKIKNRGMAGDGTEGLLSRLESIERLVPETVCLMIGLNDLMFLPIDSILTNFRMILERLTNTLPETRLIVQSVLPVNNRIRLLLFDNKSILQLNEGIEKLCIDYSLDYLDLYPHFVDNSGKLKAEFTKDGVHLAGPGYLLWKELLITELNN